MEYIKKRLGLLCFIVGFSISSFGQSYFANGSAIAQGNGCFRLTPATNWQLASVWYADKLDLNQNFDLEFELNFGNKDVGADGIVFVLQTSGNKAIGIAGGGLGFEGFSPSLGVEFDDWNNIDFGDLASDHIGILKNGSVDHKGPNSIAAPVPALTNSGNIEDGQNHIVRITWNASTQVLEVWFDCVKRQSITLDIVNSIFSGQNEVFWGFTASTGGENNVQIACLRDDILTSDTVYVCKGDRKELNARESDDNRYTWTPNIYLNDNTIKNPTCIPDVSTTYYVAYTDRCGNKLQDTVTVRVEAKPNLMDLDDVLMCIDETATVSVENVYGKVYWNGVEGKESFDLLNYEGELAIKSANKCGADSIVLDVSVIDCTCDMWYPNIFTPNSDNMNEDFGPIDPCNGAKNYSLKVFNRWGEKLFETTDISERWDGLRNGKIVVDGVYFWVASWHTTTLDKDEPKVLSGSVEIVR